MVILLLFGLVLGALFLIADVDFILFYRREYLPIHKIKLALIVDVMAINLNIFADHSSFTALKARRVGSI